MMPTSRDVPLSLGDRPRSPRQATFRHSCRYFPSAANATGAAGHGAGEPDDDK